MAKVIFILLDGLNVPAARRCMSYLRAMTDSGKAVAGLARACLPPLSRPAYATILTGMPPLEHGILRNEDKRRLNLPTLFSEASANGIITCAAAYSWFFELCHGESYDARLHRHYHDATSPINHGVFYSMDEYPDQALFADAEYLIRSRQPGFMLVHAMGADYAGHKSGGGSENYHAAVRNLDSLLALHVPEWLDAGHEIVITSDHGMDESGNHHDASQECLEVPVWLVGSQSGTGAIPARQTALAPFIRRLLGAPLASAG